MREYVCIWLCVESRRDLAFLCAREKVLEGGWWSCSWVCVSTPNQHVRLGQVDSTVVEKIIDKRFGHRHKAAGGRRRSRDERNQRRTTPRGKRERRKKEWMSEG